MKKIIYLLFLIIAILATAKQTQAVPAAPSPTCEIKLEITDIKYAITSGYYQIKAKALEMVSEKPSTDKFGITCKDIYKGKIGTEIDGIVLSKNDSMGSSIKKGQTIIGYLHFAGDERFHGNFLTEIRTMDSSGAFAAKPKLDSETIEAKLMARPEFSVKKINKITLDKTGKFFWVKGSTPVFVLFFTINWPFTIKIDANTGDIIE
jgi:hypothetical protein